MVKKSRKREPWASAKLRRPFVVWLKIEAAKRGLFMSDLVEDLAAKALGASPWRDQEQRS